MDKQTDQTEDGQWDVYTVEANKGGTMICEIERTKKMTAQAQEALNTILNLRKLTAESGTRTTRAQNDILRSLNSQNIAAVANALQSIASRTKQVVRKDLRRN